MFLCSFLSQSVSIHFPDWPCVYMCVCVRAHARLHTCMHAWVCAPLSLCAFASNSRMHVVSPSAQLGSSQLPAVYTGVWLFGPAWSASSSPYRRLWHASPPPAHAFCLSFLYPTRTGMPKAGPDRWLGVLVMGVSMGRNLPRRLHTFHSRDRQKGLHCLKTFSCHQPCLPSSASLPLSFYACPISKQLPPSFCCTPPIWKNLSLSSF